MMPVYRLPPLNALRAFEAAARHLSFAKASEELNVTPAALVSRLKSSKNTFRSSYSAVKTAA